MNDMLNIEFSKELSENELIEQNKNGILKSKVDDTAKFLIKKAVNAFEILYTKVKITSPSWNVTSVEMALLLAEELEKRKFAEINQNEKEYFLAHLFCNHLETLDRAEKISLLIKNIQQKEIVEYLIKGIRNNISKENNYLQKYFNLFPLSNHFLANYLYAECLYQKGENEKSITFANRAYAAIPYDKRIIELLKKLLHDDAVMISLNKLFL